MSVREYVVDIPIKHYDPVHRDHLKGGETLNKLVDVRRPFAAGQPEDAEEYW